MRWLARLLRRRYRPVQSFADVGTGKVEIEGRVEAVESLRNPVTGESCVAVDYRAWPPSTTVAIDGATAHGSRAYKVEVRQAVDFVLADDHAKIRVNVPHGVDLEAVHEDLLARHGVGLRTELEMIREGDVVRVAGRVSHYAMTGSPHREEPYVATVEADRFWLMDR